MCRTFFEPRPPADQTTHSRALKFGMVSLYGYRNGSIEAIFEILPLSQDMGVCRGSPQGSKLPQNFFSISDIFSVLEVGIRFQLAGNVNFWSK